MTRIVWITGRVSAGLLAGIMIAGLLTASAMAGQPADVYAAVMKPTHEIFTPWLAIVLLPALTATAILTISSRTRVVPVMIALACLLGLIVTTFAVNVPINGQIINDWPITGPPPDWADIRDRWNTWHGVRTALSIIVAGCLATATQKSRSPLHKPN